MVDAIRSSKYKRLRKSSPHQPVEWQQDCWGYVVRKARIGEELVDITRDIVLWVRHGRQCPRCQDGHVLERESGHRASDLARGKLGLRVERCIARRRAAPEQTREPQDVLLHAIT
jgi:hypothetical protein